MHLKLILVFASILSATLSQAQFKKGTRLAGMNIASAVFNSGTADISVGSIGTSTSRITGYNVTIGPSLGWFVSPQFVVGATLNINPSSQKTTYEENGATFQMDKTSNFNIGVGGFARNYFGATTSLLPFAQASLNVGLSNLRSNGFFYGGSGATVYKSSYTGTSSGGIFANAAFAGGITKMMNSYTGIDLYIGYNFSYNKNTFDKTTQIDRGVDGTIEQTQKNKTTTKFTNHGLYLGAGFQVFLRM